jgi:hypothetical protein
MVNVALRLHPAWVPVKSKEPFLGQQERLEGAGRTGYWDGDRPLGSIVGSSPTIEFLFRCSS